jgi:hypothetical protein
METKDNEVRSVRHTPRFDTDSINRALERASKDDVFIENAINLIKDLSFPAFKRDIIDQAKRESSSSANPEIIALFESLNGYMQYKPSQLVSSLCEVRRDYAQVSPSAMSNFICNKCGKQFQNQNDLIQHQQFEGSENASR